MSSLYRDSTVFCVAKKEQMKRRGTVLSWHFLILIIISVDLNVGIIFCGESVYYFGKYYQVIDAAVSLHWLLSAIFCLLVLESSAGFSFELCC